MTGRIWIMGKWALNIITTCGKIVATGISIHKLINVIMRWTPTWM